MTTNQLKNQITSKVGFPVKVRDNGDSFSVRVSKLDGTQSFHDYKTWFNSTFSSGCQTVLVCNDACSAIISKESFK